MLTEKEEANRSSQTYVVHDGANEPLYALKGSLHAKLLGLGER